MALGRTGLLKKNSENSGHGNGTAFRVLTLHFIFAELNLGLPGILLSHAARLPNALTAVGWEASASHKLIGSSWTARPA